jgi:hypothetical protein
MLLNHSIYIFTVAMFLLTCDKLPEKLTEPFNPLDPKNPHYLDPKIHKTEGPDSNAIITNDAITFSWEGNKSNMQFRYKLDANNWSEYSNITSVFFDHLDEYDHFFYMQSRYVTGDTSDVKITPFTVNAISGPALMFFPKYIEVTSGNQFQVELWVDETDSIAGISAKLIFNPAQIRIDDVDFLETNSSSFLLKNGGHLLTFSHLDNNNGLVELDIAVVTGNPRNVFGNGKIALITMTQLSGNTSSVLISNQSKFRNSDNNEININSLPALEIVVQ